MIESEVKVLLTTEQFESLKKYFHVDDEAFLYQQNAYYDTVNERLKDIQAAVRLRNFNESSEWTVKQVLNQYDALEINQINSKPIQPIPLKFDPTFIDEEKIHAFFNKHQIEPSELKLTYQIETYRYWVPTPYGELALDKSHYAGLIDYELELEMNNLEEGLHFFNQLLKQFNIPNHPAPKKIARVAQAISKTC